MIAAFQIAAQGEKADKTKPMKAQEPGCLKWYWPIAAMHTAPYMPCRSERTSSWFMLFRKNRPKELNADV